MKNLRKRLACLLLSALLLIGCLPVTALAAENGFILVVEAGGKLVIAPEYISCTAGQTAAQALSASGHTFTGLDTGMISAIDGVTGNFTRSDENGNYDLSVSAASIGYLRFSEDMDSKPSDGLKQLMTAMADYKKKGSDVQAAAKKEYDTASDLFVGINSESAKTLASNLNDAVRNYENTLTGEHYAVRFTDGSAAYSDDNYHGVSITAVNAYGKQWTDDGDGVLELPKGDYTFCVEQAGLRVEGKITVSAAATVSAELPQSEWLITDTFRVSGSFGEETNKDNKFTDEEWQLGQWSDREVTVPVLDTFTGSVYTYAEYDTGLLSEIPTLTAIYTLASTGERMEKALAFQSLTSGAYSVLSRGAAGNTVIYRLSSKSEDGYTYSQDYTVHFDRVPTLASIRVEDQIGVDQAASIPFAPDTMEYTYKVLDTVTAVTITGQPLENGYTVTVNGKNAANGVTVDVSGETVIPVTVSANGYSSTYTLTIQPGEGKSLSFLSERSVTVEVVNSNGVVMPYTTLRESATQNRYRYILVPGETYHYVATRNTYYHITDDFSLEEVANSTIIVDFSSMSDWLTSLAYGKKTGAASKNSLKTDASFTPENHSYRVSYEDTEHMVYAWVATGEKNVSIQAIYNQVFSGSLYHGKEKTVDLPSGAASGTLLNRLLMKENPVAGTVAIRLTKEENGVTFYQDYVTRFDRTLTLKDMTAQCDGAAAALEKEDGTKGFTPGVKTYSVTVSMAAQNLELFLSRYEENTCYGEEDVGYRIRVDGTDVTAEGGVVIPLDGTINTQTVTVTVENNKAPDGTGTYTLNILKSPPVEVTFETEPADALLHLRDVLTGVQQLPDDAGNYLLCEGSSYSYALTKYGYEAVSGTLTVTRDDAGALVISNGTETYPVTETEGGGAVTIVWTLNPAAANPAIDPSIPAQWADFRGSSTNNGVTDVLLPTAAQDGTLYWANQLGVGFDSDAVGSPILVDGDIITYAGDKIYRVDTVSGEVKVKANMDHKSSFSITPPVYADGMVFVALSGGTVQAFNAATLESLWIYTDKLGGQPNCPLKVKNGYLYTGFWNSETGNANFVCLSITDEDPAQSKESKCASWYYTSKGGFYWAGAYVADDFLLVGTDDGGNGYTSQTSRLLLLDPATGELLDSWDGLNADIRSTVVYDAGTDAYYFTSKGGTFYSVQVTGDRKLTNKWSVNLANGVGGVPMSTSTPVVYGGRAYIGVSGAGQFTPYSGHNITVIDVVARRIAYRVETQGYPQTSGLLTTAYEQESGCVYVYFFDNMTPGKLRVLRDRAGQTVPDYVTTEGGRTTAYALFTPTGDQAQYAICSPIADEYGTVYFKNDSARLMAYGSAIERLEITQQPTKTAYAEGETFDPAGMVVTAVYANGKTRDVTAYVTYKTDPLDGGDGEFAISFPYVMYHNEENGTEMTSGVETMVPAVTLNLTVGDGLLGDVNGDGKVDQADAQMILDYEAKRLDTELSLKAADVSGDGVIDSSDAVLILQYAAGTLKEFPAAAPKETEDTGSTDQIAVGDTGLPKE